MGARTGPIKFYGKDWDAIVQIAEESLAQQAKHLEADFVICTDDRIKGILKGVCSLEGMVCQFTR